ncbi:MAG: citryl-CoA lyase [Candidatus Magasanikbacteria bacterium]|nr:citryl-CoA lyase [Candidatus Magasanikbacteria bacterium]
MPWKTALTTIQDGKEMVRGRALAQLMETMTFTEAIFFLLIGREAETRETKMLNALLVAALDHGVGAPSATVARTVVSTGNSLHTAVAAGVLTLGELHGGAIEAAAQFFKNHFTEKDISGLAKKLKAEKVRVPGFGHKVLAVDERAKMLFALARKNKFHGRYCVFAEEFEKALGALSSKPLPINIDGAMAAILLEMGFAPGIMKGFFIIGRAPGLVAHVYEQMTSGEGIKRADESEIEYTGETGKHV